MKKLELIRYDTMNSWNQSTAPAFNMKIYKVIPRELQGKAYELMETEDFYFEINDMVGEFGRKYDFQWQAGFNGRSGGYLVLYQGGRHTDGKSFSYPGRGIETEDVPKDVLKSFKKLAADIVKYAINCCKNCEVIEEEYIITKTRKVMA